MHLNNKGFAISAILYSMLILVVVLMFLTLSVLSNRKTSLDKFSGEVKEDIKNHVSESSSNVTCTPKSWTISSTELKSAHNKGSKNNNNNRFGTEGIFYVVNNISSNDSGIVIFGKGSPKKELCFVIPTLDPSTTTSISLSISSGSKYTTYSLVLRENNKDTSLKSGSSSSTVNLSYSGISAGKEYCVTSNAQPYEGYLTSLNINQTCN